MQVKRGTELANEQGVGNAKFMVKDALKMEFPDNSFDIVWACESGEHMPDKKKYIDEMMRVLKPGGKFVMATWCQRDDSVVPFTKKDKKDLQFLYEEWYVNVMTYVSCFKNYCPLTFLWLPVFDIEGPILTSYLLKPTRN
jgi:MPBQ/MSBQ methyltransferase